MAAKENLITTTEITVNPREIDFVTRFQRNWIICGRSWASCAPSVCSLALC